MGQTLTGVELHLELEGVLDDGAGFGCRVDERVVWFKVCAPASAGRLLCDGHNYRVSSHGQGAFDKAQIQGRKDKEEA